MLFIFSRLEYIEHTQANPLRPMYNTRLKWKLSSLMKTNKQKSTPLLFDTLPFY